MALSVSPSIKSFSSSFSNRTTKRALAKNKRVFVTIEKVQMYWFISVQRSLKDFPISNQGDLNKHSVSRSIFPFKTLSAFFSFCYFLCLSQSNVSEVLSPIYQHFQSVCFSIHLCVLYFLSYLSFFQFLPFQILWSFFSHSSYFPTNSKIQLVFFLSINAFSFFRKIFFLFISENLNQERFNWKIKVNISLPRKISLSQRRKKIEKKLAKIFFVYFWPLQKFQQTVLLTN